ncbi:MAG: ABC transporter permease, partial [Rhodobacteraceae bacterium]|nr:ABC transporter permease [Paracoccaceae bacterium]
MSAAETAQDAAATRNGWWLSAPALTILAFAAVGPLLIVFVYSFLTPGQYGNVEWIFSLNAWRSILWTEDIFEP